VTRRLQLLGILVLVGLYTLVRLNSAGVFPCSAPGGEPCPPKDHALALVPASTMLYAHLDLDRGSQQYGRARGLASRFPHAGALISSAVAGLGAPSGAQIDLKRDVKPWLGGEAALARFSDKRGLHSIILIAERDERLATAFADRIGPGKARVRKIRHERLRRYGGGFAATSLGGFLVLGDEAGVREAIDVGDPYRNRPLAIPRPAHPSLATVGDAVALRAGLPENRVADVYLSRDGVQRFLARAGGYAPQIDTLVDYGATGGLTAAAVAHEDGLEVQLLSALKPKLLKKSPSFAGALSPFEPTLASALSHDALLYLGVGKVGAGVQALLGQARRSSPALGAALRGVARKLSAKSQLNIARQALPLLGGEGAFVIEPTAKVPYAELIVAGVPAKPAGAAIAKVAAAFVRGGGHGVEAAVTQRKVAGVAATSVQVSPSVNLTFAPFDGRLVVASDPAGVAEARGGKDHLSGNDEYSRVRRHVRGPLSALVFLNLQELLALGERAGLASNPAYATFRDDIHHLVALGIGVSGGGDQLRTRLFLAIAK
jgi:hypothetical protein